jgi:SnoaL-like domain
VNRKQLQDWVDAYERAWRAPGTDGLGELFAADSTYSTAPYLEPHRGLEAIAEMWEAERSPGEAFSMSSEVVAVEGDVGVVRIEVNYTQPRQRGYRDLWVLRLDEQGRCTDFEEWPFWPPGSEGAPARGPGG